MKRYALGIDVGTTYTSAAIARDGRPEVMPLGSTNVIVPTVVVLRDDGEVLVGESAERRASTEPTRVAREFKRRMGDPTPIVVGGTPYGAEALVAHVLRAVAREATAREGAPPTQVVLTHPASWSTYKVDLLAQAARQAGLEHVSFLTEPQAAAIHYSSQERLDVGAVIAVYDLGGGTFDAAVLRRTAAGFDLLGVPEGMERFGGIDIDRAILAHLDNKLAGELARHADVADVSTAGAMARVRDDARTAKETLSNDSDVVVPVLLPGLNSEVRLTRSELENMIRPRLAETVESLQRTVRSAGLEWNDLQAILAVGGSSRIPLVREVVRERTGRPVVVDTHPNHATALGAAAAGWALLTPVVSPTAGFAPPTTAVVAPLAATPTTTHAHAATQRFGGTNRTKWLVAAGVAIALAIVAIVVTRGGDDTTASIGDRSTTADNAASSTTQATASSVPTSSTAVPTSPLPATTVPTQAVIDGTGSFAVDLPVGLTTSTKSLTLGGIPFAHVSGAADLTGYLAGNWAASGVTVLATESSLLTPSQAVALLSPRASCTSTTGERPYSTVAASGVIVEYDGCGGGAWAETIIAVNVPAVSALVIAAGTGVGPASTAVTPLISSVLASVRPL